MSKLFAAVNQMLQIGTTKRIKNLSAVSRTVFVDKHREEPEIDVAKDSFDGNPKSPANQDRLPTEILFRV
jgi:hypothetical protein